MKRLVSLATWFASLLAVVGLGLIGIVLILFNRERKNRRRLGARRERAVENPAEEDAWQSAPHRRQRSPGK